MVEIGKIIRGVVGPAASVAKKIRRFRFRILKLCLSSGGFWLQIFATASLLYWLVTWSQEKEKIKVHVKTAKLKEMMETSCDLTKNALLNWDFEVQKDPHLIQYIRDNFLIHSGGSGRIPNPDIIPQPVLNDEYEDPSEGVIMKTAVIPLLFMNYTKPGTFFEGGVLDGKYISTTYYLEKRLGWSGMLVEANPKKNTLISARKNSRENVWTAHGTFNVAVDKPKNGKDVIDLDPGHYWHGWILRKEDYFLDATDPSVETYIKDVPCFPLYSLLAAANLTNLDFFSLDVEGVDWRVLLSVPWEEVNFKEDITDNIISLSKNDAV
ncbi:unnamed protein product [Notodromas monacha]|uniref:Methyltransferase FkbM domain-containing protein n=1 Tax=Notodromas monacha TaxID=399045 RepID=A0A7R9C0A3_9CRUS|nr:unnamed protein product [Notodromas monacha]CAG0923945.1 unnamed protein product [Notodromas monacha]